jgi:hypothetical protein
MYRIPKERPKHVRAILFMYQILTPSTRNSYQIKGDAQNSIEIFFNNSYARLARHCDIPIMATNRQSGGIKDSNSLEELRGSSADDIYCVPLRVY